MQCALCGALHSLTTEWRVCSEIFHRALPPDIEHTNSLSPPYSSPWQAMVYSNFRRRLRIFDLDYSPRNTTSKELFNFIFIANRSLCAALHVKCWYNCRLWICETAFPLHPTYLLLAWALISMPKLDNLSFIVLLFMCTLAINMYRADEWNECKTFSAIIFHVLRFTTMFIIRIRCEKERRFVCAAANSPPHGWEEKFKWRNKMGRVNEIKK